jgi:hypothetical protein
MFRRSTPLRLNPQSRTRGSGPGVWQAQDPYSCWRSLLYVRFISARTIRSQLRLIESQSNHSSQPQHRSHLQPRDPWQSRRHQLRSLRRGPKARSCPRPRIRQRNSRASKLCITSRQNMRRHISRRLADAPANSNLRAPHSTSDVCTRPTWTFRSVPLQESTRMEWFLHRERNIIF